VEARDVYILIGDVFSLPNCKRDSPSIVQVRPVPMYLSDQCKVGAMSSWIAVANSKMRFSRPQSSGGAGKIFGRST